MGGDRARLPSAQPTKQLWLVPLLVLASAHASCGEGPAMSGSRGTGGSNDGGSDSVPDPTPERPTDYIRNDGFSKLIVELDTVPGLSPRSGVIEDLKDRLGEVLDKPRGISIITDETDLVSAASYGDGDGVWTFAELQQLANERSNLSLEDGEIDIHTMWLDGVYTKANVLGVAWSQRFLAIFAERIGGTCGVIGLGDVLCPLAEATIWTHEVGHVIGLVDNGIPMVNDHQDPDHPGHDVSDESVMYWAYEGVGVMDVLQARLLGADQQTIPWGAECLADLAAVRGD